MAATGAAAEAAGAVVADSAVEVAEGSVEEAAGPPAVAGLRFSSNLSVD
jgi:hypothetical protein